MLELDSLVEDCELSLWLEKDCELSEVELAEDSLTLDSDELELDEL